MEFPTFRPRNVIAGAAGLSAIGGMYYGASTAPADDGLGGKAGHGLRTAGAFAVGGAAAAVAGYSVKPFFNSKFYAGSKARLAKNWAGFSKEVDAAKPGLAAERAAAKASHDRVKANTAGLSKEDIATLRKDTGSAIFKDFQAPGSLELAAKGFAARSKALYHNFGSTTAFMGAGAVVGGIIGGSMSDDTAKGAARGAAIGAGAGFVAKQAIRAVETYKAAGSLAKPGILGLTVLASAAVFTGVRAATRQPESTQYGSTDDAGETQYSYTPVKDRISTMNASGALVFGLHNKRRG